MKGDSTAFLDANDFLWKENQRLHQQLQRLRLEHQKLQADYQLLQERLAQTSRSLPAPASTFIKPPVRPRRRPGRKAGHAPALRPPPPRIDVHQPVPMPVDALGQSCCPECKTQLADVKHHDRLVEDIIPSKVIVTCYHTASGYCPSCRKTVESRADEQPPAADLPHAQLGLNALSAAAMMRVCYRLPLRQITRLFQQIPGLRISPGAIARQLQRLSRWLDEQYRRLKLSLRRAGVVYADETSWRTDGQNRQLWTITNDRHTLYHVDQSRGGKVIAGLLGERFGVDGRGTLVSDFYGAYQQFDCPQQKCLAHLSREIRDLLKEKPRLENQPFFKQARRLIRDMLRLRDQRRKLPEEQYRRKLTLVERRLVKLGEAQWDDPDARRLSARLRKNQGKLTTFLHKPEVEPTNNHAERALRPAVVMRKITGGSRSKEGADAWAVLSSLLRTVEQQGRDVLQTLKDLLTSAWAGKESTLMNELLTTPAPAGR